MMDECLKGVSFRTDIPPDPLALKYIESEELERTWKATRRQRVREQEQKVWKEFIGEQDIVHTVYKDDPYQFIVKLPEPCLQTALNAEPNKEKQECDAEETVKQEDKKDEEKEIKAENRSDEDSGDKIKENIEETTLVSENKDIEEDDAENEIFHIFDDEVDDNDEESSVPEECGEVEEVASSVSPPTLQELMTNNTDAGMESPIKEKEQTFTHPSNTANIKFSNQSLLDNSLATAESSVNKTKLRYLSCTVKEEMQNIIRSLDQKALILSDHDQIESMRKRANEFSVRFSRIYLYQMHRQMRSIKRSNKAALPFAKHTRFQSLLPRLLSLFSNIIHALQVYHKSIPKTSCLPPSDETLRALVTAVRNAHNLYMEAAPAKAGDPVHNIYIDNKMLDVCTEMEQKLDEFLKKVSEVYTQKSSDSSEKTKYSRSKKSPKHAFPYVKKGQKSTTDTRLNMYSFDTLRINLRARSTSSKVLSASKSKETQSNRRITNETPSTKKHTRSSRKPLMRDTVTNTPRDKASRVSKDTDIPTMVEAFEIISPKSKLQEVTPRLVSPVKENSSECASSRRYLTPRAKERTKVQKNHKRTIEKQNYSVRDNLETAELNNHKERERDMFSGTDFGKCEIDSATKRSDPKHEKEITLENNLLESKKVTNETISTKCDVTKLLKELCGGDGFRSSPRSERGYGAKNAQLICINGSNHPATAQPSTPQLLKILEETIQKKDPRALLKKNLPRDLDKLRLTLNISEEICDKLFQYRKSYLQHMLSSSMYANSTIGKPWEVISSISDQIIDELLAGCAKEMQLDDVVNQLYMSELN